MGENRTAIVLLLLGLALAGCGPVVERFQSSTQQPTHQAEPALQASPTGTAGNSGPQTSPTPLPAPELPKPELDASATPTQLPEPTQIPPLTAELRQLTQGGCCVQPFWSPDGNVLFLDKPDTNATSGIYAVSLDDTAPRLYQERIGLYSANMRLAAYLQNGQTVVEDLESGQRWAIPNQGREVAFSPDGLRVAWTEGQSGPPFDSARRQVWTSLVDGSQPFLVIDVIGGGLSDWFPDGRLLVSGRISSDESQNVLWAVSADGSQVQELARGERLRSVALSPDGRWLAYLSTFSETAQENGLWVTDTHNGKTRRVEPFGGYRWRPGGGLLVVPLEPGSESHRLLEINPEDGGSHLLTPPELGPFKIANGDWAVSLDGNYVVFVSSVDNNLWLLQLPGE